MPSRLYEAAMECLHSWDTCDENEIIKPRAENTIQVVRPETMGIPTMHSVGEVKAFYARLSPLVKSIDVTVLDVIEDTNARKVALWCTNVFVFYDERVPHGHSEYVMMLEFDENYK